MALRLNGSSSGYVELEVPAAAGSHTLTLPNSGGSSGQYLQTNGTGTLSWQTLADNGFESYAVICDQKTQDTDAGAFSSGAWRTRDLNTEILDPDSIVTISSNQFTLPNAGTYLIEWLAPAVRVGPHKARLYDVTGAASVQIGPNAFSSIDGGDTTFAFGSARVTITSSNTYRIEHRCEDGSTLVYSFGYRTNFPSTPEIYTVVKIFKEA